MVKVLQGDLLNSKMQTWVNTVNCVGVMGKGIALEFKKRFPKMYEDYSRRCRRGEVKLGAPYLYRVSDESWILNFPTKDHWRSFSSLENIETGLKYLLAHYHEWGIKSLAVPPLGCGQGQLEWRVVGPTIYRYLKQLDIPVELYAPYETPAVELQEGFLNASKVETMGLKINPAWVALVEILNRIETESYHWPVGRTTFQKIGYVASEEGLPLEVAHRKGDYGPYSAELKVIEARLQQHGLIREERQGRHFVIKVGETYQDAKRVFAGELQQWESIISKTADLFMRTTAMQAELAATVIFTARNILKDKGAKPTEKDILREIVAWKKTRIGPKTISLAIRNLAALGWIEAQSSKDLPLPKEETV